MAEQKNVLGVPLTYKVTPAAVQIAQIAIHEQALELARFDELPAQSAGSGS